MCPPTWCAQAANAAGGLCRRFQLARSSVVPLCARLASTMGPAEICRSSPSSASPRPCSTGALPRRGCRCLARYRSNARVHQPAAAVVFSQLRRVTAYISGKRHRGRPHPQAVLVPSLQSLPSALVCIAHKVPPSNSYRQTANTWVCLRTVAPNASRRVGRVPQPLAGHRSVVGTEPLARASTTHRA